MIDRNQEVRIEENIMMEDLDGEAIVLDTRSGLCFGLNSTGATIWRQLKKGDVKVGDIHNELCKKHDQVPVDTLWADLCNIIVRLEEHGLVIVK